MTGIAKIWFMLKTNAFKIPIVTLSHPFDAFVLLTPISSEISILSYSSIYNWYKHSSCGIILTIFLKKKSSNYCHCWKFQWLIQQQIITAVKFNVHKFFTTFTCFTTIMVSISFLILSQISLCFFNTSLFASAECNSIEVKTKHLFPFFSSTHQSILSIIRYKGFTVWLFS